MVDAREQVQHFQEFFEATYLKKIHELVSMGKRSVHVDFRELAKHDPELAEQLLTEPEETVKAAEIALQQFDLPKEEFRVRFLNLPDSQKIKIRDVRSTHLDNFIVIEGIVRQASDVRPQIISAKFECRSCGNLITIPQVESKFKEPSRCSCGSRGRFRVAEKILVDAQRLVIEESSDALQGGEQPKRLSVFVREDLVEPRMEKKTTPGSKVKVVGILKEVPLTAKSGGQLTRYDLALETNSIESVQETYEDIDITPDDEQKIKELANDANVYQKLLNAIAPSIFGHEDIKGALVLQLMGGVRKEKSDGTVTRGDMHILLVGDPGAAKSTLLTFIAKLAPRARYVAGRGASAAGITASVVKDEFLRGWALEAGAIVLANNGILCLHPESEVLADNTIVKIKDLFDESKMKMGKQGNEIIEYHDLDVSVPTLDNALNKVVRGRATKIRRKWYKNKILTLTGKSSLSLTLTPEHKLIDGSSKTWKEARHFKTREKLICLYETNAQRNDINTITIKENAVIDEIVDMKEENYEGYVYDLYVPETHNFLANGIFVHNCLDEMDKMSMEDTSALHEAMAQQQVTISKANIQATLSARTTVLAAANPKLGRFDPFQPIAAQINLPPALINRFDLIFPVRDIPDKEKDMKIASHILEGQTTMKEQEIPADLLRKYIAYVHQNIFPKLSPGAIEEIKEFYVGLRNSATTTNEGVKPIPISARQLEALVRLAEGSARVRLSNQVTKKDARNAIKILKFCMMQVGFDYETGQFDMDRIATGITASTRNKILVIKEIIHEIEARGKKHIPLEDIYAEAAEKNLTELQVEEILEKLKKEGEIYEPKRGWISKL